MCNSLRGPPCADQHAGSNLTYRTGTSPGVGIIWETVVTYDSPNHAALPVGYVFLNKIDLDISIIRGIDL